MFWLIAQMWFWLLVAALFGAIIGWALRARSCRHEIEALMGQRDAALAKASTSKDATGEGDSRVQSLETQLAAEKDEVSGLKAKLAALSSADASQQSDAEDESSLTWRNRYLESRVRFLEGKLASADSVAAPVVIQSAAQQDDIDTARLKWRNRYLEGRVKYLEEDAVRIQGASQTISAAPATEPAEEVDPNVVPGDDTGRPATLKTPRGGEKDDLKRVSGIGPKIEGILNDLGIFHFEQISKWSRKEVDWVDSYLTFKGRIDREQWIPQSALLARGETPVKKKK